VLLFTLGLSLLTGLLFGLLPAVRSSRVTAHQALQAGTRTASAAREARRLRSGLVVAEIAISLILLVGAGLLLRSFARLLSVDPGFVSGNVLTFQVALPGARYDDTRKTAAFWENAVQRIRALPGVEHAGLIYGLPLTEAADWSSSFDVQGWPPAPDDQPRSAEVRLADTGYFPALHVPLLRGRLFTDTDGPDAPRVVLINQAAAEKFFPNLDPIGHVVVFGASMGYERLKGEIVGVVGNVRDESLEATARPAFYVAAAQAGSTELTILARTSGDPMSIAAPVRSLMAELDPEVPIAELATMDEVLANSVARRRFFMLLLASFAGLALLLAGVGIYGVMAYTVSQRTQEIGVRMALGAARAHILGMVMRQSATLIVVGSAVGLLGAFLVTRVLGSMLVGVSTRDPLAFAAGTAVLAAVALLASFIPARRATAVDPAIALRYE
jgi:predicted permease